MKKVSVEEFVNHNSKAFNIFITKDSCTRKITHNTEIFGGIIPVV
jgi:hypothetical protein